MYVVLRFTSLASSASVRSAIALLLGLLVPSPLRAQSVPLVPLSDIANAPVLNPHRFVNRRRAVSASVDLAASQISPDLRARPVFAPRGRAAMVWSRLDFGVGDPIFQRITRVDAIATIGSDVYVGGDFTAVCFNDACSVGNIVNQIAKWNAFGWSGVDNGLNGAVFALAAGGTDLYAGGYFDSVCGNIVCNAGGSEVNYIAKWNGSSWSTVGNGLNGYVYALAVSGDDLYAAGAFTEVCGNETCDSGNSPANHIARWTASGWSGLGDGLDDYVYALAVSGTDLYAGGDFAQICGDGACSAGNTPANHVAKWNGSSWSALGNGVRKDPALVAVNALAVSGTTVYAGGGFRDVCGDVTCTNGNTRVNYIAKWDGSAWSGLQIGVNGFVTALAIDAGDLYAGGTFFQLCGSSECANSDVNRPAFYVARWDGRSWFDLRYGVNSDVYSLDVGDGYLYVGGGFKQICLTVGCDPDPTAAADNIASYSLPIPLATPTATFTETATLTPTFTHSLTATPTATGPGPSVTPTRPAVLVGDCSGSGSVSVTDLITLVNIILGNQPASACPDGIPADTQVDIALLIQAVNNALNA